MIANKGRNTVTLPSTLAAGKYLVRFDLMAMHSASGAPPNGAQFYPSCAQLEVTGSGTQALPAGIAIPGTFTADTPGIVWVRRQSFLPPCSTMLSPDNLFSLRASTTRPTTTFTPTT